MRKIHVYKYTYIYNTIITTLIHNYNNNQEKKNMSVNET